MLTVILATKNRARILQDVLSAFCRLTPPAGGWKLVVVDNGSTDGTSQVLDSFSDLLPLITLSETKSGKNYALNTGLELLEGDLAVFSDDDVFPKPDWLVELRQAADSQTAYSMFGGAIVARWEAPPPAWTRWLDQAVVYSVTDPSLKSGSMPAYLVFGPNMAVRSALFEAGLRFDCSIGPHGRSYPMGSETELLMRLSRRGHKAWYAAGAEVEHFVRCEQLDQAWALRRAIHFGRGQCRLRFVEGVDNCNVHLTNTFDLAWNMLKQCILISLAWMTFKKEAVFRRRWKLNFLLGQAVETRILSREHRSSLHHAISC